MIQVLPKKVVTKVIVDRKDAVRYIKNKYSVFISFDSFFNIK